MENTSKAAAPPSHDELVAMQAAQGEALAAQEKRIAQLMSDLEAAQAEKGETKVVIVKDGVPVTLGKKKYLVVHGLILTGGRKTAEEIAADKKLCEELVAANSSALKEI